MKEIKLTQGKVALVDDEDFEYLDQWNWFAHKAKYTWYARRNYCSGPDKTRRTTKPLHREIFEYRGIELGDLEIDHINGNGLDNRKSNLRAAKHQENNRNSRKKPNRVYHGHAYKGITFARGHWGAKISTGNRNIHLGYYSTPEEAAKAYDEAAKRYFGEFARTNESPRSQAFPDSKFESTVAMNSNDCPTKRKNTTSKYRAKRKINGKRR